MRANFKKPRIKKVRKPRPVPPPKPPRPRRSQLRRIYGELITTDRDQRVEALKKAMHWYEELLAYLAYYKEWTIKQRKQEDEAVKHRLVATNSNQDEVKEVRFTKAIQCYEKMTRRFPNTPKVGAFLSKYSRVRSQLERRKRRLVTKFGEYLELVDKVLQPKNYKGIRITLRVDKLHRKTEYSINSEGHVTFDRKFLDESRRLARKHGMLPGLMKLFPVLTEAAGLTMEVDADGHRTGRYVVHGSKRHSSLLEMLQHLVQYQLLSELPKKLIRRHKRLL